ncbi:MAG: carotenoid oxygenase family protein [Microcystaceae cyanobacterium]
MTSLLQKNSAESSFSSQDWLKGYDSQPNEENYWIEDIEGHIPTDLSGTLFRNGPGLLEVQGTPLTHPFDGDGMVSAFSFMGDGRVHFRNRFVRTEGYVAEQEKGEMLYRGVFGAKKPGGLLNNIFDLKIKNIANTNVIYWGDKLLALWEAAQPYRLNPATLDTVGLETFDGLLNIGSSLQGGDSISAHPWIDPCSEMDNNQPCLVNFAIKPGLSSKITIYEFDVKGEVRRQHSHAVPGFCFIHDFAITPNYCIFLKNAVSFNPIPYFFGVRGAGECVNFEQGKPAQIIIIPRKEPYDEVITIEADAGFVFHHANAFEDDNQLYLDSICYEALSQIQPGKSYRETDFSKLEPGQLWRFTLNLEDKSVKKQLIEQRSCEFPTLNPNNVGRDYRYLYIGATHNKTGNAPLQAILKLDLLTGEDFIHSFAPRGFISEPVFVPHPNATKEDEGWILALIYDAKHHRSDLVILDAQNIEGSPLAILHLKQHIPYGLHGNWTEHVFI